MKKNDDKTPIVSGSYQIVSDKQKDDVENLKKDHNLDEESLYYARLFMKD